MALKITLQVPLTGTLNSQAVWGDEVMAVGLALALNRLEGIEASVCGREEAQAAAADCDALIDFYPPPENCFAVARRNIWWYQAGRIVRHIEGLPPLSDVARWAYWEGLYASPRLGSQQQSWGLTRTLFFPMGASSSCWFPTPEVEQDLDVTFIGNCRGSLEAIDLYFKPLVPLGLKVFGVGWEGHLPPECIQGPLAHSKAADVYRRSKVVLSHHNPWHTDHDVPTSRLWEAGLCGCCLVSDHLTVGETLFGDTIFWVKPDETEILDELVRELLRDAELRADIGASVRQQALQSCFEARAQDLVDWILEVPQAEADEKRKWLYWNREAQPGAAVLSSTFPWTVYP